MSAEIDLTGDGGVKKRILRESKADALSPSDSHPIADVHYEGRLLDTGDIFDSSREDNAVFTFEVGKGKVIRAWDIAVKTMKVGEVSLITCRSDYAYGDDGAPPEIPPGATLVFEVELMAVKPPRGASADTMVAEKSRLEKSRGCFGCFGGGGKSPSP
eukprot:TRINITY_DN1089_c0_g1_i1.p1 TRINITY_DN1089_c0_g1~~TRINITY_DN1089_c0_g1_i1.p1  ORF type:complete len:158 (+),score=22.50 TRINITY_DN1089_c0_g1_i1:259-732(+)